MVSSVFAELCNHHHSRLWNVFIIPRRNPGPLSYHPVTLQSPWPLATLDNTCVLSLWIRDISHQCNGTMCGLLCPASFAEHSVFALSWLRGIPSCGWTTFSSSALPSVAIWDASMFGLLNDAAVLWTGCWVDACTLDLYLGGVAGSDSNSGFNILGAR